MWPFREIGVYKPQSARFTTDEEIAQITNRLSALGRDVAALQKMPSVEAVNKRIEELIERLKPLEDKNALWATDTSPWATAVNQKIREVDEARCRAVSQLAGEIHKIHQQLGLEPVQAIRDLCERVCKLESTLGPDPNACDIVGWCRRTEERVCDLERRAKRRPPVPPRPQADLRRGKANRGRARGTKKAAGRRSKGVSRRPHQGGR